MGHPHSVAVGKKQHLPEIHQFFVYLKATKNLVLRDLENVEMRTLKEQRQHHNIEYSKSDIYQSLDVTEHESQIVK